jgi:hypothetical protein
MKISKVLDNKDVHSFNGITCDLLVCPACKFEYTHMGKPLVIDGRDYYKAWSGRGDLMIIPVSCECGSKWEFCIGYHEGQNFTFIRIVELCS